MRSVNSGWEGPKGYRDKALISLKYDSVFNCELVAHFRMWLDLVMEIVLGLRPSVLDYFLKSLY